MRGQKGGLRDRFISYRMIKARIKKEKSELDFFEFEQLLRFGKSKPIVINFEFKPFKKSHSNEEFILLKEDCMRDKVSLSVEKKEVKKKDTLDFSMFDELLNDFSKKEVPKIKPIKRIPKDKIVLYLKKEIKYYQNKLDNKFKLNDLENYEQKLFEIKNRIDALKKTNSTDFMNYKFKATSLNEIIELLNSCKNELDSLENKDNKVNLISRIDENIKYNLDKQKEFLREIEKELEKVNTKVLNKIYFCMIKRMLFNLYRLLVGLYQLEMSDKNYLKLNTGIFLIINALVGMDKALRQEFDDDGYYYYKEYASRKMNKEDIVMLTYDFINKSISKIDELKILLKKNFSCYKDYSHDYEEIYFKVNRFKKLLCNKGNECLEIIDKLNEKTKEKIMV